MVMFKFSADKMDAKGCLKVNQFLQVEGLHDVFAVGDCSTADDECKMAYKANLHANTAVQNIQNLADEKPMKPYNPRKWETVCGPRGHSSILECRPTHA